MTATDHKEKRFTAQEICTIINACRKSDVSELSLGQLSVKFYPKEVKFYAEMPKAETEIRDPFLVPGVDGVKPIDLTKPVDDAHTKELLENMRVTEELINDPAAYEQSMIDSLMNASAEQV